jgi:hypothetical protein
MVHKYLVFYTQHHNPLIWPTWNADEKTFGWARHHHSRQHTHEDLVTPPKQLQLSRKEALSGMT